MKNRGFTLVEAILTLALLTGGLLGIMVLYERNVSEANEMEQTLTATYLAQERMEQIVQNKKYQLYDSIVSANYPSPEDMTSQGFPGYTRTITITEVSPLNLTSPQANTGYKRVTVSVQVLGGDTVTLTTLLTKWAEQ